MTASPSCRSAVAVIATHGRAALLERTLQSLAACDDPGVPFEVLVIENGAPAQSERICTATQYRYPLQYHFVPEPGKSGALNVALQRTAADLVIFLDDDIRLEPATLRVYVEAANRYGRGHFFGGAVAADYESPPPDWLVPHLPASVCGWDLGREQAPPNPEFLGANWAAFREELLAAGGFALDFGPGPGVRAVGQETEMQRRLRRAGVRGIFLPGARIWHYVPAERCTADWALDRRFRVRYASVLTRANGLPRFGAVPLWLWRQYGWHLIQSLISRPLPPARRIARQILLAEDRGSIHGYRALARKRSQNQAPTVD
ncbi:MAG TPA: glycosyltransferase [Gemmatimonadales bacterium]|nr:glycosyltransferase [Gemmatimonadales bacterium]